ncbi:high-affinity nicotinic acid transporter [Ilyonectria robusta]
MRREQQQNLAQNLLRFASSSEEYQKAMETKLNKVIDYLDLISEQTNPHSQEIPAQPSGRRGSKLWKRDVPKDTKLQQTSWDTDPAEAQNSLRLEFLPMDKYVTEMEQLFEQKRKTILETLHFSQVKEREFAVAEAHKNTFMWIFNETGQNNFVAWLRDSDDLYWIAGKAGSGKSTLMRFLTDYPTTRDLLKQWAGKNDLIVAKHYFWNPGTAIQKSQEGLFRSILLQILYQRPQLIPAVCADRWNAQYGDVFNPWSRTELMAAFVRLGNMKMLGCRICLFIDGLDEYDGDHAQLVSLIRRIGASQDIKICASSRQWLDFSDAFEHSEWKLYLQDLTHDDIRKFIQDNLNEDVRFNKLQQRNKTAAEGLGLEITERAHGVFLWVFLVVRSLLRGLRNEDDISDLIRRLRELPSDLRKYFDRMFVTIEDVYRERTARLFLTMAHASTTFPVITFYFMDLGDGSYSREPLRFLKDWPDVDLDEAEVLGTKKRQLIAQCKDLIFITPEPGAGVLFSERVGFLHRTVIDFLHTVDVRSKLLQLAGPDFNPNKVLLETNLGQLSSLIHLHGRTFILPHLQQWILGSLYYAHVIEASSGIPETDALDELEAIIMKAFARWDFSHAMDCFFKKPDITSFLELSCQCDLASYVCKKHPQLTPSLLDTLAPGWRDPFEIQQQSNFEICKREKLKDPNTIWRLGRQAYAQPITDQKPATEVGWSPEQDRQPVRARVPGPVKTKGRVSSKTLTIYDSSCKATCVYDGSRIRCTMIRLNIGTGEIGLAEGNGTSDQEKSRLDDGQREWLEFLLAREADIPWQLMLVASGSLGAETPTVSGQFDFQGS